MSRISLEFGDCKYKTCQRSATKFRPLHDSGVLLLFKLIHLWSSGPGRRGTVVFQVPTECPAIMGVPPKSYCFEEKHYRPTIFEYPKLWKSHFR